MKKYHLLGFKASHLKGRNVGVLQSYMAKLPLLQWKNKLTINYHSRVTTLQLSKKKQTNIHLDVTYLDVFEVWYWGNKPTDSKIKLSIKGSLN
jgi:hypothetical protein